MNAFCKIACSCGGDSFSMEVGFLSDTVKVICEGCGEVVFITSKTRLEEPADTQNEYRAVIKE